MKLLTLHSEKEIHEWFTERSGLYDIMGIKGRISLASLYRITDKLLLKKEGIEERLIEKERGLFGLGENIILYDLTNTYFEGLVSDSQLARRGVSKERRNDRPLVTVGIVVDEEGFPKISRVFSGNVSEPSTLEKILEDLLKNIPSQLRLYDKRPTIVMDAGIVTEENLRIIRDKGLDYICVDRRRSTDIPQGEENIIHETEYGAVKAIRAEDPDEVFLYCISEGKAKKEEAIKNRFQLQYHLPLL